ncbi:MAG: hypothetical protein U9N10_03160, partial [Bacillota bacterium]|nr:hypothetical protein [Bacillota bacterium]
GLSYWFSYSFFKKLEMYIVKDLTEDNVKYIINELNKYKLGRNSYNWDILAKTVIKVNKLDISQEIIDKFNDLSREQGILVEKVIDEYEGE